MPLDEESILDGVKQVLQVQFDYDVFDFNIMMHINTAFTTLYQLGIGPSTGFQITSAEEKWSAFLGDDPLLNSVKTYVCMRVKLLFDPPQTSYQIAAVKEQVQELEWRLAAQQEGVFVTIPVTAITSSYGGVVDGGVG